MAMPMVHTFVDTQVFNLVSTHLQGLHCMHEESPSVGTVGPFLLYIRITIRPANIDIPYLQLSIGPNKHVHVSDEVDFCMLI